MHNLNRLIGQKITLKSDYSKIPQLELELLACYQDRSLMVSLPESSAQGYFKENRKFYLTASHDNVVYRLNTWVEGVMTSPFPHLRLAFPQVWQRPDRQERRFQASASEIALYMQAGSKQVRIAMGDISFKGARLIADQRLGNVGDTLNLTIKHRNLEPIIHIACEIRYISSQPENETNENRHYQHGVKFLNLSANAGRFIEHFVRRSA